MSGAGVSVLVCTWGAAFEMDWWYVDNSKGYRFKNIFDFITAGDWDCVAAVEPLPAIHYSVDFIFLSFGIMGFIVEF